MNTELIEYKRPDLLVAKAIKTAMTYEQYRDMIDTLAKNGATTGDASNEAFVNYTRLNARRFKRWEKTLKLSLPEEHIQNKRARNMTWLVITESWCGDAAHLMPVFKNLAGQLQEVEVLVVLRDENPDLMDEFLTDGSRSIPKLIAVDNDSGRIKFSYGPRPSVASELAHKYKTEHGSLSPEFKENLQRWYNGDKGQTTFNDLVALISR